MVLRPGSRQEYVLFIPQPDSSREVYSGPTPGIAQVIGEFHADTVYNNTQYSDSLRQWLQHNSQAYVAFGDNSKARSQFYSILGTGEVKPDTVIQAAGLIHRMRLVKSDREIQTIRRAVEITGEAHREMMRMAAPGQHEYEVAAAIEYVFSKLGAGHTAFPSIVASGTNANILHYQEHSDSMRTGELLLVDIGAEYNMYTADITRTVPVSGKFTPKQRQLYEAVLRIQNAVMKATSPGITIREVNEIAQREAVSELVSLGILTGNLDSLVTANAGKRYLPHGVIHHIGLDAHDPGGYHQWQETVPLEPGMVVTVEPGLYFTTDDSTIDASLRGTGIRIEDDLLITANGNTVISSDIPKPASAIEAMMQEEPKYIHVNNRGGE